MRARFGTNEIQNGLHGSKTIEFAQIETEYMFPLARASKTASPTSKSQLMEKTKSYASTTSVRQATGAERTYGMIKPDAVSAGKADEIIALAENAGFKVIGKQEFSFTPEKAQDFYAEHVGKDFFENLIQFMTRYNKLLDV